MKQTLIRIVFLKAIHNMAGKTSSTQAISDELNPNERVEKIFSKMDKDGDESITAEEFKKAAAEDPSLVMIMQVGEESI